MLVESVPLPSVRMTVLWPRDKGKEGRNKVIMLDKENSSLDMQHLIEDDCLHVKYI